VQYGRAAAPVSLHLDSDLVFGLLKIWAWGATVKEKKMLDKDILLTTVLAASGGKRVIKYDDKDNPSVMVRVPRFNLEDIHSDLGAGPHPAFIVNGQVKDEIFIGAYQAVVDEGRACSLPGVSPTTNISFDDAKAACENKGPGWHLMTAWEWAAVALWCMKNGYQPRGNFGSLKSSEAAWETGTPAPDNPAVKILTGTGPVSWRHDNTSFGIADLVGNIWEWNDGLKITDGQIYAPDDNSYGSAESDWPAAGVFFDASDGPEDRSEAARIGEPVLSNGITHYSETPTPADGGDTGFFNYTNRASWVTMAVSTGFDELPEGVKKKMAQLLLAPKLSSGGGVLFAGIKGGVYIRNYGTRFPLRGRTWHSDTPMGLAALDLEYPRASINNHVGLRPAFIA
jgi:hypothetical protein